MKKAIIIAILGLSIFAAPEAKAETICSIPVGTYQYLFSDGHETYYYNDTNTIRLTAGTRILESGDFSVKAAGNTYQRSGDQFTFINTNGHYTSTAGNPIFFTPAAAYAQTAAALAPGSTYRDSYGTYTKQQDGNITFTPKRQLAPLVINANNCAGGKTKAHIANATVPATTSSTYMQTSDGNWATVENKRNGDQVTTSPYGSVVKQSDGTTITTSPYGTVIQH